MRDIRQEIRERLDPTSYYGSHLKWETKSGKNWAARCPFHEDTKASLFVEVNTGLWHCMGCARGGDVFAFQMQIANQDFKTAKLELAKLAGIEIDQEAAIQNPPPQTQPEDRKIIATYRYTDEKGILLYEVVRFDPKGFAQRRPSQNGDGWTWGLDGSPRVPYLLPDLVRAVREGKTIFVPEGEKDVHTLKSLGLEATTNSGGAGRRCLEMVEPLRGADVVVVPDDDDAGDRHAKEVVAMLSGIAKRVRVLRVPDAKDVSDWIQKGKTCEEFLRLLERIQTDAISALEGYEFTDSGNAGRFMKEFKNQLRFMSDKQEFISWNGKCWDNKNPNHVWSLAKEYTERIVIRSFRDDLTKREQMRLRAYGYKSRSERGLNSIVSLSKKEPELQIMTRELDPNPFLFNVMNGTIDLKTGKIKEHDSNDFITKISNVTYDTSARSELWENLLRDVTGGDPEFQNYLARIVGYMMTGSTREEKFFMILGPSATGKSTFVRAIKNMLGEYASTADFETFLKQYGANGGPKPDLARMVSKRAVFSLEVDRGKSLAEGLLKTITGGDEICVRDLYSKPFEYKPQFKLVLVANDAPKARSDDEAMWRRMVRVPFENKIPENRIDPNLKNKLMEPEVTSAILLWAIGGCQDWLVQGLNPPDRILKATGDLRAEMNPLDGFIQDCCILGEGYETTVTDFISAYKKWAESNGEKMLRTRDLVPVLESMGISRSRTKFSRYYKGIGLVSETHPADDS